MSLDDPVQWLGLLLPGNSHKEEMALLPYNCMFVSECFLPTYLPSVFDQQAFILLRNCSSFNFTVGKLIDDHGKGKHVPTGSFANISFH